MAMAAVNVYTLDPTQANLQGPLIATGTSDEQANFKDVVIPADAAGPFLVVITSTANTIDLNTNTKPAIADVRTITTRDGASAPVYATPLTSMAVSLAAANAVDGASPADLVAGLGDAANKVVSALGMGMNTDINIFTAPPLVTNTTGSTGDLKDVASYRSAIAGAAAIIYAISQNTEGGSTADTMASLAQDLTDGNIDGKDLKNATLTTYNASAAQAIVETDPASLKIPGTDIVVADAQKLLVAEASATGTQTDTAKLSNGTIVTAVQPAVISTDTDADGVLNAEDAFPNDPKESVDTDRDAIGNNADGDDDGDGVDDSLDAFPLNAAETLDSDSDGLGNNSDSDDDGDNVTDDKDAFPLDASKSNRFDVDSDGWPAGQDPNDDDSKIPGFPFLDSDADGTANLYDTDDDNDGVVDENDAFPLNAKESKDTDGDGFGDSTDDDIDGDNTPNHTGGNSVANTLDNRAGMADAFPFDASEQGDVDRDGLGDNRDPDADGDDLADVNDPDARNRDTDGDGVRDGKDAFPVDAKESFDTDGDGVGNNKDNCRFNANANQVDTDADSFGDACDQDDDNDGVLDITDAAPLDAKISSASDADGDGWLKGQDPADDNKDIPALVFVDTDKDGRADNGGLAPDDDDDNDGVTDAKDAFPLDKTEQFDADKDGVGDRADLDDDNDTVVDTLDRFPLLNTETQDADKDGVGDNSDNCPSVPGPQSDWDKDNKGDVCDDDDDNDGVPDYSDGFPFNPKEGRDSDGDGVGDNADLDDDGDTLSDLKERELGTNPLDRDTDHDSVADSTDNCPVVANGDQTDSDADNKGDLCDDPPSFSGYFVADFKVTAATRTVLANETSAQNLLTEVCAEVLNDTRAEVMFVSQKEADLRISSQDDRFDINRGVAARTNSFGQVSFEKRDEHFEQQLGFRHNMLFKGQIGANGTLTGNLIEERAVVKNSNGLSTQLVTCQYSSSVVFTPMPAVPASAVMAVSGDDQGVAFTSGERRFDSRIQYDTLQFVYELINAQGQVNKAWDAKNSQWLSASPGDMAGGDLNLTASGWIASTGVMSVLQKDDGSVLVQASTSTGDLVESWKLNTFKLPIAGKPMNQLVDPLWVELGLGNARLGFTNAKAAAVAIGAESTMDVYQVSCGDGPGQQLACRNGVVIGRNSLGQEVLATQLADLIKPSGPMNDMGEGIRVAQGLNGEIFARIEGAVDASQGEILYYLHTFNSDTNSFTPLRDAAGVLISSSWAIKSPVGGAKVLMLATPVYLRQNFGLGDADAMFLTEIPDSSNQQNYVRIGHFIPAGKIHRDAGLNQPALTEALANFNYQAPLDTDQDGVPDMADAFPLDNKEQFDMDKDGVGNNADAFPFNPQEQADNDRDGLGNNADADDDNDGIPDNMDAQPFVPNNTNTGPVVAGNQELGKTQYLALCKNCHGEEGKGTAVAPAIFPLKSNYGTGDIKVYLDGFIAGHKAKLGEAACDQPCAQNITAFLYGVQNANPLPVDPNPMPPIGTVDTDKDGVPDDRDMFPTDPTEQFDSDKDGVGDNKDPDSHPQLMDRDGDGAADQQDNCILVANADQLDINQDGLGDACELSGFNMTGRYWTTLIPDADSMILSQDGTTCVADLRAESFLLEVQQIGSQLFLHKGKDEGGPVGIMLKDGTFTLQGGDHLVGYGGLFDPVKGSFGFDLDDKMVKTNGTTSLTCVQKARVTGFLAAPVNEQAQLEQGVFWLDSEMLQQADGGQVPSFTYGRLSSQAVEEVHRWNPVANTWDLVPAEQAQRSFYLTEEGVKTTQDLMAVVGFGSAGEGATLALTFNGQVTGLDPHAVELSAFVIAGAALSSVEPKQVLPSDKVFPSGAQAFNAQISATVDTYSFACDQERGEWFASHLTCDNLVAKYWHKSAVTSLIEPVAALSLADIINTAAEMKVDPQGAIWVGRLQTAAGQQSVMAYLVSANGSPDDDMIEVIYRLEGSPLATAPLAQARAVKTQRGVMRVVELPLPEDLERQLLERGDKRSIPIVFEEAMLDQTPYVRHGRKVMAGAKEQGILFNKVAFDAILANFAPPKPQLPTVGSSGSSSGFPSSSSGGVISTSGN